MLAPESFPSDLQLTIALITITPDQTIDLALASTRDAVGCPRCGAAAHRIHSRYQRRVADLPWQGRAVHLQLAVRRFFCETADCSRRIFAERFPGLVAPHGRQSDRLRALFDAIGLVLGGEGGARLAAVATFMRRDYHAIFAALTLPWSNGQTEGQVTRLKLVKRQMYGRGRLDLLKRRLIRPT